jgi:predicted TIM-barrel fold metal-dependent hydrolase
MIIDSNMHWLPENLFDDKDLLECFLSAVPKQYGVHARVCPIPGKNLRQIVIEQPQGCEVLNYAENQYCCEEQIKDMNEAGIDIGMLRIPCWQEWLDLETCKKLNNGLAGHLEAHPGRFLALAVVPPWGTKDSLKEMERCIKELGFSGVQMAAHYGDLYLDEEEFRPHFKKISEMNIPVVVHHTPLPVDFKSLCKYTNLRRQYGRCVAQGTAVGRELFSDMFEEFPNLKMIHSMLGGGFFAYSNMLAPKITGKDAVERFQTEAGKINKYLENNIYYDVSGAIQWGRTQLECAVKVLGADHILYGSSYPIRRDWFSQGVEFVKNLDIDDKSKSLILSKNAIRLFNIK